METLQTPNSLKSFYVIHGKLEINKRISLKPSFFKFANNLYSLKSKNSNK